MRWKSANWFLNIHAIIKSLLLGFQSLLLHFVKFRQENPSSYLLTLIVHFDVKLFSLDWAGTMGWRIGIVC